ncbi:MAG: nitrophenyl compound nitroreductase subunit ArsF family protein [Thermodesulfobacteriota bacterium]|nr:nitrophenyl compound nitroreductase subunit ArsF family protein [Thermodesulfobacteriota bacterium]
MDQLKKGRRKKRFPDGLMAVFFAAIVLPLGWAPAALCNPAESEAAQDTSRFIAYYFYTSKRCSACVSIEQLAREAVTTHFKEELASGKLQWHGINVEQPENKHFIQDFQLYTKSVIIAEYRDGKPVRYENLKNVWRLYRDREKYFDYIAGGVKSFMESK